MKKTFWALFVCLALGLGIGAPVLTANADSGKVTYDTASKKYDLKVEEEIVLDNAKYSSQVIVEKDSIVMNKDEKSFNYHLGTVYSNLDSIFAIDNEVSVELNKYNWYAVDYFNGDLLMADVIDGVDRNEYPMVVSISVYKSGNYMFAEHKMFDIDYQNSNILELLYVNKEFSSCTKVIAPIDNAVYSEIESFSNKFDLSKENTDIVSQVLIESYSFESDFKSTMHDGTMKSNTLSEQEVQYQLMSMPSYGTYANNNKTVRLNAYDDYTDFDGYLKEYETTYKDKVHTFYGFGANIRVSDDPIVNIIPKNLFRSRGIYSYIGKEYGFYIKTYQNYDDDNLSDFIVFDIDSVIPYPERSASQQAPKVEITPVFSGRIQYHAANNIVIYDGYYNPNLALANIQVAGNINNINEKNIGDSGYIASNDYGYAFNSYYVEAVGTGLKRDSQKPNVGWLKATFGAAKLLNYVEPGLGTAISTVGKSLTSIYELAANYYTASERTRFDSMDNIGNDTYKTTNVILGNANTQTMIKTYGNLLKGFETEVLNPGKAKEENVPLMYKTSEHHFKVEYNFCQKDSTVNWDSLVAMQIALDIYTDTTGRGFLWIPNGSLTKQDSVIGGRVDYYNESPTKSHGGNIDEGTLYRTYLAQDTSGASKQLSETYSPLEGSYVDFYFTPNRTFTYVIETLNRSPNADPYLKIYDSSNNRLTYNDDSGTDGRNSKITITLTGGSTYKIRTLCYNYGAGSYEFMVRKEATLNEATYNSSNANYTVISQDSIWYKFVPKTTGFYTFYTVGSCDTFLSLYDSTYNKYAFNDDGGTSLNAMIDMYLTAGKTYYLKVNCYSKSASGSFNLYANLQRVVRIHELSETAEYNYSLLENEANFFRYTPTETRNYTIHTYLYEGDPLVELYDENMNLITSNDDGGKGYNALITYSLQTNKTYYIKVRNFGGNVGNGKIYFSYA